MNASQHWQQRVGSQRDWVWRGWQTRYTYIRPSIPSQNTTPIILLHGFGTSIGHWRHNIAALGEQHTVYALDLLGFGASQKPPTKYNIAFWVEQIYDFWCALIRQPVVLIGNSIGSLVALAAAATHPEMAESLIMMSIPDPSLEEEAIPEFLRPVVAGIKSLIASPPVLQTLFRFIRRPSIVRQWAGIAYANSDAVTNELVEILVAPAHDRRAAQAFSAIFKAIVSPKFGPSVKKTLPTLDLPMLLIWGKQDRMVPLALADQFTKYNSSLELLKLDNAGHCPHDECPEQVNQVILDWLKKKKLSTGMQQKVVKSIYASLH